MYCKGNIGMHNVDMAENYMKCCVFYLMDYLRSCSLWDNICDKCVRGLLGGNFMQMSCLQQRKESVQSKKVSKKKKKKSANAMLNMFCIKRTLQQIRLNFLKLQQNRNTLKL